jgi:hypothetical protein
MNQLVIEGIKPPPAPKQSKEIVKAAVLDYIERHGFGWAEHQHEECADDIAKCWHDYMDGYELGRELEKYHMWEVDMQVAEDLDSVGSVVREWVEKLRTEWAAAWDIQPPHPIGTRLTKGVITGINTYSAATYEVQEDAPRFPGSKLLVKFEDAQKLMEGGAE